MDAEQSRTKVTTENLADVLAFLHERKPVGIDGFLVKVTPMQLLAAGEIEEDEIEGVGCWTLYIGGQFVCMLAKGDFGPCVRPADPSTAS
jgi:hypothetical protein